MRETTNVIVHEVKKIENQIKLLKPTTGKMNGNNVFIRHTLLFPMIDGKECNAIAENPGTQRCYLCQLTCKDFNNLDLIKKQKVEDESKMRFGLSPLHAWIRFFKCLMHISYNLVICQWQVRGKANKNKVAKNKKRIQKSVRIRMGLLVNKPKPGFGTTNDGNTARRFFTNSSVSAKITRVNKDIIKRFHAILVTISSMYRIKIDVFK